MGNWKCGNQHEFYYQVQNTYPFHQRQNLFVTHGNHLGDIWRIRAIKKFGQVSKK
jgi:ribosomal protein S4E